MFLDQKTKNLIAKPKKEIQTICSELFRKTPINYFCYQIYYYNGTNIDLCNRPDYHIHTLGKEYYPTLEEFFARLKKIDTKGFAFMSEKSSLPSKVSQFNPKKYLNNILDAREFGIKDRFFFGERKKDHIVLSGFGVGKNFPDIIEYYLNNTENLNQFVKYFEFEGRYLIKNYKSQLITLPNFLKSETKINDNTENLLSTESKKLSFYPKKYYFDLDSHEIYLTQREMQCIVKYLKGATSKELGRELGISKTTVEKHIQNVKLKFDYLSKKELLSLFKKQGVYDFY